MTRFFPTLVFLLALTGIAGAVEPRERLTDPVQEARAREVSRGLRCLVCQNESIDDSNADLAHDIRVLLRERIAAGDSNDQAIRYIVERYGDFVLLRPPVKPATYVLWFAPPALLLAAALGAAIAIRRRGAAPPLPALSAAERERLDLLMHEADG